MNELLKTIKILVRLPKDEPFEIFRKNLRYQTVGKAKQKSREASLFLIDH